VLFAEALKGSEGDAAAVEEIGAIDPKALLTAAAAAGTEAKQLRKPATRSCAGC
jgi:hypothetical protein